MTQANPLIASRTRTWSQRLARTVRRIVRMTGVDVVRYPPEIFGIADIAHLLQLN